MTPTSRALELEIERPDDPVTTDRSSVFFSMATNIQKHFSRMQSSQATPQKINRGASIGTVILASSAATVVSVMGMYSTISAINNYNRQKNDNGGHEPGESNDEKSRLKTENSINIVFLVLYVLVILCVGLVGYRYRKELNDVHATASQNIRSTFSNATGKMRPLLPTPRVR